MYTKPVIETTEEIHAEVSCTYSEENYQTTVSLRLRPAYEFQIPKGLKNNKCWNVCTSDNSHLGILVQFNVGHCFRAYLYPGYSSDIKYYESRPDVDTLEKALVQFVVFHNKDYKPVKVTTRETTKTVVTRETPVMSNADKLLINLALKNNITTLENGTRLSPEYKRTEVDWIEIDKPITVGKIKEKLSYIDNAATFIVEDYADYYSRSNQYRFCIDEVIPGINTLTEQERQYLELKIREQTEQVKLDKAVKEKTLREQKAKEERELYEKLKKKYDKLEDKSNKA